MIIAIVGGVGSGKSLSVVKYMKNQNRPTFCNFDTTIPHIRLRWSHIINDIETGKTKTGKPITDKRVNWGFWNDKLKEYKNGYDIIIDEVHNVFNSRRSMSKDNIIGQKWISQIRKILSSNENNHLIVITQELNRIDVTIRDLLHYIIKVDKITTDIKVDTPVLDDNKKLINKSLPVTYIIQKHFYGEKPIRRFYDYDEIQSRAYNRQNYFIGNLYYKYYNSYQLIEFGDEYV